MLAALLLASGLCGGCTPKRHYKSAWLVNDSDKSEYLREAVDSPNADVRRGAIVQLARTRYANDDDVFETCDHVARRDASASVRASAIRLLTETNRTQAVETMLRVLELPENPELVRGVALIALHDLTIQGAVDAQWGEAVVEAAEYFLRRDESRDIRIAATRVLGEFPRYRAMNALIEALDDRDFGVVYHAEQSLHRLTGEQHDHDPSAWRSWLAATDDPFAGSRTEVESAPEPKPSWWQRAFVGSRWGKDEATEDGS